MNTAEQKLSAKVVIYGNDENEVDIFMSDFGVATMHHNGEHMLTTYYQDRVEENHPELWEKLNEGKSYMTDWIDKQEFDDEMMMDAILWLGGEEDSVITKVIK